MSEQDAILEVERASEHAGDTSLGSWLDGIPRSKLLRVLRTATQDAARGLSDMVRYPIRVTSLQLKTVPIAQIAVQTGDPEAETVGIYMRVEGDLSGQAILMLSLPSALNLVDMLLDMPSGTTTRLGELERSALAEAGNLMVSYFLSAVAAFLEKPRPLRPSPPAVVVDMLGAILDVMAAPVAISSDEVLIMDTNFAQQMNTDQGSERVVQFCFWILPDIPARGSDLPAGRQDVQGCRAGQ
jgi:chemotaxis protein CheC